MAMYGAASHIGRLLPALFVAGCWANSLLILGPLWLWPALLAKIALAATVVFAGRPHSGRTS
jgi:hypothetical protein